MNNPPQKRVKPSLRLVHPAPAQPEQMPPEWSGAPLMKNPPAWAQQIADNLNRGVLAGIETN